MTVPTVTSVNPSTGHSGGRTVVEVVGTGFALPPPPPPTGVADASAPSVSVTFGGAPAPTVWVASSTLLYALTPEGDPDAPTAADVVVQNLDAAGAPVPGESASLTQSYTFVRPDLSVEGDLAAVVRALIKALRRQIVKNTVFTTHTDYDADTGDELNYVEVQTLPALILSSMDTPEDRAASNAEEEEVDGVGERFAARRPPVVVSVRFTIVGVSDNPIELLNLLQATRGFFKKNARLRVPRSPSDPGAGFAEYAMGFAITGGVGVTSSGDNSNVESFSGQIVVEEVRLEEIPGLPTAGPAGAPTGAPHEGTMELGWKSLDGDDAVQVSVERKPA